MFMPKKQGPINHVFLVVDASTSMRDHKNKVIEVFDATVASLANLSLSMNQETRLSVYFFSDQENIRCVYADLDVLRMPSLQGLYEPRGNTALLDAVILAEEDAKLLFTKYGDHATLQYVITDGEENRSRYGAADRLARLIAVDGGRTTRAILVPNEAGKRLAIRYGFPAGNIKIWDATSSEGMADVGIAMAGATQTYMTERAAGSTRSTTLFANQVTAEAVQAAGLKPITGHTILPIFWDKDAEPWRLAMKTRKNPDGVPCIEVKPFIESIGHTFVLGTVYYRLEKSEKVDSTKKVIIVDRKTKQAFGGQEARTVIGLTDSSTRIKPQPASGQYDIYVLSTSVNRLLPMHSSVLVVS